MAENSKIEWCHHTANLWWGCTEVHAGCDNCYARWGSINVTESWESNPWVWVVSFKVLSTKGKQ